MCTFAINYTIHFPHLGEEEEEEAEWGIGGGGHTSRHAYAPQAKEQGTYFMVPFTQRAFSDPRCLPNPSLALYPAKKKKRKKKSKHNQGVCLENLLL